MENTADYGGGLLKCGSAGYIGNAPDYDQASWMSPGRELIQANIIAENTARFDGGGLYDCGGRIENNTVYGNTVNVAGNAASIRMTQWQPGTIVQNNIFWGGLGGTDVRFTGTNPANGEHLAYCAIDEDTTATRPNYVEPDVSGTSEVEQTTSYFRNETVPGTWIDSSHHIGANGHGLVSTTLPPTEPLAWHGYMHLTSTSPLIDKGQPEYDQYADEDLIEQFHPNRDPEVSLARDFDMTRDSHDTDTNVAPDLVDAVFDNRGEPRDIGCDEWPTSNHIRFRYWWRQFQRLPQGE